MGVYENVDKTLDIERRFDRAKMAADTVRGSFTKNIGIYDSALHEKELYSERLIEDFYTAVEEKQFQVFYQPKFDIRPETPVLASAEALVRWFHPSLGMISPGEFIPLFEDNGLIQTLDRYVWETAADQLRLWKEKYGFIVPVSVNVSRIDMYDPRLVETFQKILSVNGLTPAEFLLEITESAYTQDSEQIIETVNLLRSLGFSIEMDDFGTGYSSLNMISTLPIDALKLDMQFIRTAFSQNRDTRMLEVIIDIADYLSVPTIAEGVETKDQLQALKAMGCDIVQGYYFSKPVPHEEFKQFLVKRVAQVGHGDDGNMAAENRRNRKQASPEKAVLDFTTLTSALSSDVESIYYVDTVLDTYMEFRANGAYKKLQIEVTGDDFFEDCRKNISEVVFEDDRDKVAACLEKGKLLSVLRRHHVFSMVYRLVIEGSPLYYRLKVVQADASDGRYIIIGVSNIDAQLPEEERLESQRTNSVTFAQISEALSRDYFSIYYVNIRTNHFIEYSSDEAYKALGIETMGEDFFGQARESIGRVICPEDQQHFLEIFTKDRVLLELAKTGAFSMVYRMMFGDVPTYVQMKATHMSDPYDPHIVIGMSNVEEQMRREREHSLAVQAANRDPLTGVKSKHAYTEMEKEVNESIARGDEDLFAIAVCDLNGLKNVNDTLGHIAGDKYLRDGCTVICQVFKHSPVYRIGGDEFAAVLRGADYEDRGNQIGRAHV